MSSSMRIKLLFVASLAALLSFGCIDDRVAEPTKEGNASETVAFIGGQIVDSLGKPVANAEVTLTPEAYSPLNETEDSWIRKTQTNNQGQYRLDSVSPGRYALEGRLAKQGRGSMRFGVRPSLFQDNLRRDTLKVLGALQVGLPEYIRKSGGWIRLPGTRFIHSITPQALAARSLKFDSLPFAEYPVIVHDSDRMSVKSDTIARNVKVTDTTTRVIRAFSGWSYHQAFELSANLFTSLPNETLTGFPLLLRLDSGNIDFSQTATNGSDLRFSKMDGTSIAFEIERWDSQLKQAEIWLLLDTVKLAAGANRFEMHWGKAGLLSASNGLEVFKIENGHVATWHLSESSGGLAVEATYRNSVENENHGNDSVTSTNKNGAIGLGQGFSKGDCIAIPNPSARLKPRDTVMAAAWVNATTTGPEGSDVISMGNNYGIRILKNGNVRVFNFNFPRSVSTDLLFESQGKNLLDGNWHYLVGQITGAKLELFIDGESAGSVTLVAGINYLGGPVFFIGKHGQGEAKFDYIGNIDEVSISTRARSTTWLRLSYLTQRPGANGLIKIPY